MYMKHQSKLSHSTTLLCCGTWSVSTLGFIKRGHKDVASLQEESSVGITWCQVAVYADSFSLNWCSHCCSALLRKLWVTCIYFVLFPVPAQRHFRIYFFMSPNFSSDMFWNITNQSELWWNSDSACLVRLLFWFCVAGRVWQSDTNRTHFCSIQLKRAC